MKWFKEWGWLVLLAIAGVTILILTFGRNKEILRILEKEKEIIDEKAEIRKKQAKEGVEAAKAEVERRYAQKLEQLDEKQKQRAKELADNPDDLVDALLRGSL